MPQRLNIATWNIHYSKDFLTRLRVVLDFYRNHNFAIIALQEIPGGVRRGLYLTDIENLANNYNLGFAIHPFEYPEYQPGSTPNLNSIERAYLVLYDQSQVILTSNYINFYRYNRFVTGDSSLRLQCRPPVLFQFHLANDNSNSFSFLTWHNEATPRDLAVNMYKILLNLLMTDHQIQRWIIAADLNIPSGDVREHTNEVLLGANYVSAHFDLLDAIVSPYIVNSDEVNRWNQDILQAGIESIFYSDAHNLLWGAVEIPDAPPVPEPILEPPPQDPEPPEPRNRRHHPFPRPPVDGGSQP